MPSTFNLRASLIIFSGVMYSPSTFFLRLSDVGTRIEASRQMTYNAASYLFEFKPKPELTSMAKAYSSETAVYAAEEAMEILGDKSLYEDVQRIFRNAKIMEIWEGTSEIEKLVIARYILKGE